MEIRDAIKAVFGALKPRVTSYWREIGGYAAAFTPCSGQIYANETCRACIRKLAEETAKANARVAGNDRRLETLLNLRPNLFMNGKDFLYKCRTLYEIYNTLFIYINRDDTGKCISLYPLPNCPAEAVEVDGQLYIRFYLPTGQPLVAAWADLAVLRKDYNASDIFGDDNSAIRTSLDLLQTTSQGLANAIKSTANLRGILKSTKGMLSDEDIKRQKDTFVRDYLAMENTSGIAMTDSTVTFTPVTMQPAIASYKSIEDLRNNIYRYFGLNEGAVTNTLTGDAAEAVYEGTVEPFLVALSLELSYKVYTDRQRGYGNGITYESNRMQFMTSAMKLALVQMMDRESLTINEWREVMNLAPLPDGDKTLSWQNPKGVKDAGPSGGNLQDNVPK